MIKLEQEVFIQLPSETKQRILHPAKAVAIDGKDVQLIPSDPDLVLEADQNIRVFHQAKDFMQQTATVVTVENDGGQDAVTILLTSDPASAESREFHRVSAVLADLTMSLASEDACPLVDISATGFAVIAYEAFKIGDVLDTELRFEGDRYAGKACVQSVRELGAGRTRYGLLPLTDDESGTQMFAGLQRMTTALQRQQLKRLSGAV